MRTNYKTKQRRKTIIRSSAVFILLFLVQQIFSQNSYTFTNCGATGSVGPTQIQVTNTYSSTNLSGAVGTTSTGIQTWTAPYSGNFRIEARGAQGGISNSSPGGLGASLAGDFALTSGEVLYILVGQMGENGGSGPGGGGGGSYVVRSPYTTTNSILVIAGGGSGNGNYSFTSGALSTSGVNGGVAGGTNGSGGLGGTRGAGGGGFLTDGSPCTVNTNYASPGQAFILGGRGGPRTNHTCNFTASGGFGGGSSHGGNCINNGGAGGGYSGGGGSSNTTSGGGGSLNQGTNQTNAAGNNAGDGRVIITELCSVRIYASGSNSINPLMCSGNTLTLTTDAVSNYSWSTGNTTSSVIVVNPTTTTVYTVSGTSSLACTAVGFITVTVNSSVPALTVTPSSNSVCLNNTVSVAAAGALSYTFSGGISNGVAFTPSSTATYTILGENGCGTSTALTTITVSPLPVMASVSPATVCAGNTASLTSTGATSYTWLPMNSVGANINVSPQQNTTYTVIGETGNCAGISTVAVFTDPVPSLTVTVSHFTTCAGESSTLTVTGGLNYTWTPGGTGSVIVVSPLIPTAYNVVGENSFGCTSSTQQPVIAYAGPNMNIAASSTLICAGSVVTLNSNGATTYNWSNGATTAITTATPASTTIYTVVGSSPNSQCSTTKTIEIQVFTATIAVSNPTTICSGASVTLNASGADTYIWSTGFSGSSINVSPIATTVYTVNGVSTLGSGTCASTATTQVTVNALPPVLASSTRSNICRGESTTIDATGANTYSWSTTSTSNSIVVSPTVQTSYQVTGTDANGCKNTSSIIIRVYSCVGLEENVSAENTILVYPNPSAGELNISAKRQMNLRLLNELGQLILEINLNSENNYTSEMKGLSKGVYFLTSTSAELPLYKKIVVQ